MNEGKRKEEYLFPRLQLDPIPQENLLKALELDDPSIPPAVAQSIEKSSWFRTPHSKIYIEIRNPSLLKEPRNKNGLLYISDFDNTITNSTLWHKEEFQRLAASDVLHKRGIFIPVEKARDIFYRSEMSLPGVRGLRYTPRLNLILASEYAIALERGEPEAQAWEQMLIIYEDIKNVVMSKGETALQEFSIDTDIAELLFDNHIARFVVQDFVEDFLQGTNPEDIRAIATRGNIGGVLGQIYKLHTAGLMERAGKGVDMIVYTNDLKADAIPVFYQLFPYTLTTGTRLYDDDPTEIERYLDWARSQGLKNLEVIRVNHPNTRWRNVPVKGQAAFATDESSETIYDVYFASEDVLQRDLHF